MDNIKLILPGDCIVKKNSSGELWFRTDKKTGRKIPLPQPIHYWSPAYQEWAKKAVSAITVWKTKNPDFKLLTGRYIVTFFFFRGTRGRVDISNLLESPQDVLAGNAGKFLNKVKIVNGKKTVIEYDHNSYKILADDNCDVLVNHGATRVFYSPSNPHTEIFISPFTDDMTGKVFSICHPGMEIGDVKEEPSLFPNELFGGYI